MREVIYFGYLPLINLLGFVLMCADKRLARRHKRRIPERTLLGVALLGGSLGSLLGMYGVRHKTRHARFAVGLPLLTLLDILLLCLFWFRLP